MSAKIVQITQRVTDRLNAEGSPTAALADARRVYDLAQVDNGLERLDALRVLVCCRAWSGLPAARKLRECMHEVNIGIQQRVSAEDVNGECDSLALLVEQVVDMFVADVGLEGVSDVTLLSSAIDPVYHPDHLEQYGVFTSVITLTFKEWRARA